MQPQTRQHIVWGDSFDNDVVHLTDDILMSFQEIIWMLQSDDVMIFTTLRHQLPNNNQRNVN